MMDITNLMEVKSIDNKQMEANPLLKKTKKLQEPDFQVELSNASAMVQMSGPSSFSPLLPVEKGIPQDQSLKNSKEEGPKPVVKDAVRLNAGQNADQIESDIFGKVTPSRLSGGQPEAKSGVQANLTSLSETNNGEVQTPIVAHNNLELGNKKVSAEKLENPSIKSLQGMQVLQDAGITDREPSQEILVALAAAHEAKLPKVKPPLQTRVDSGEKGQTLLGQRILPEMRPSSLMQISPQYRELNRNVSGTQGLGAEFQKSVGNQDSEIDWEESDELLPNTEGSSVKPHPKALPIGLSGGEFLKALNEVASPAGKVETPKREASSRKEKETLDISSLQSHHASGVQLGTPTQERSQGPLNVVELNAHVVPGAMSKGRLTTDSLIGVSSGIRSLMTKGGGEIRIHLRPDNLGELNIRVATEGNRIKLQIQASDEKAKAILEESMSHLKEGLAAQSMSLGQVDVTVANSQTPPSSETPKDFSQGNGNWMDFSGGFQDSLGQTGNQNRNQGQSQYESRGESDWNPRPNSPARLSSQAYLNPRAAGARLDVRA